jgi:hypothetical protein
MKTLVQDTSPPFNYYLINGGFLNSNIKDNADHIRFDVSEAEDGESYAYCDRGNYDDDVLRDFPCYPTCWWNGQSTKDRDAYDFLPCESCYANIAWGEKMFNKEES